MQLCLYAGRPIDRGEELESVTTTGTLHQEAHINTHTHTKKELEKSDLKEHDRTGIYI